MKRVESEEASNDDTTIISELLHSAEAMHTSTVPTTDNSTTKLPLQQKHELQFISSTTGVSATSCDVTKQNEMAQLQQCQQDSVLDGVLLNSDYSGIEGLNKIHVRHVHIPYILNGELYQIQTQDGENVTVKCCHCPPDRVYRGSVRSTGNFHMHIKRRHPDLLEKLHDMKVNALLERRDRLMRSRKISQRNNRNRSANGIVTSEDMYSYKNEEKLELTASPGSQIALNSTVESSLMHTHKLKIRTAFQRHQMQQREAAEMRNWKNISDYVVMPIDKTQAGEEFEQPINYSLKSQEERETLEIFSTDFSNSYELSHQQQEQRKLLDITTQNSLDCFISLKNLSSTDIGTGKDKIICENHPNNRSLLTSSTSASCSSVMSNYSSNQYDVQSNRPYNRCYRQYHNISIIKPEQLLLGAETEAIDLTMHTDSGIFSNSEDNDSENNNEIGTNNNENNNNSNDNYNSNSNSNDNNNNEAASFQESNINITPIDGEGSSNSGANAAKWQDLLMQVENSLRAVQREMNVRNQIESNRMFLDVAKFKFLNPAFQFNW